MVRKRHRKVKGWEGKKEKKERDRGTEIWKGRR